MAHAAVLYTRLFCDHACRILAGHRQNGPLPVCLRQEGPWSSPPHVLGVPACCCCCCLQEEVTQKSKQLKALYTRYRVRRAEAADLQAQFQVEREDLLADYRALSQQIKLKNLAIAAFIPPAYQDLIMARCAWNEYEEQWVIAGVEAAGEGSTHRISGVKAGHVVATVLEGNSTENDLLC